MSQFQINDTPIEGVYEIILPSFEDRRGSFVKTFHHAIFQENGLNFELKESYFSFSARNVIRGMHFQLPPHSHAKIVFCPLGSIDDTVVDLRRGSATYGAYFDTVLSAANHKALYIPVGCAHGFQSLEDHSMTYYLVSSEYHPQSDVGIRYDSFGKKWRDEDSIVISDRDMSFPPLSLFDSPF